MKQLLKADLRRFFKDKLFLVSLIVIGIFAIITPLLFKLIASISINSDIFVGTELDINEFFNAKSLSLNCFNLSSDVGFILTIFLTILICKDFSYGTIRNKVVSGHTRHNIYLSSLITSIIFLVALILGYYLLNLGVSLCLFPFANGDLSSKEIGIYIVSILLELLIYIAVASFINMLVFIFKSPVLPIVIFLGLIFLASILVMVNSFMVDESAATYKFITWLIKIVPSLQSSSLLSFNESTTFKDIYPILVSNVIYIGGSIPLGILIFNKSDLK